MNLSCKSTELGGLSISPVYNSPTSATTSTSRQKREKLPPEDLKATPNPKLVPVKKNVPVISKRQKSATAQLLPPTLVNPLHPTDRRHICRTIAWALHHHQTPNGLQLRAVVIFRTVVASLWGEEQVVRTGMRRSDWTPSKVGNSGGEKKNSAKSKTIDNLAVSPTAVFPTVDINSVSTSQPET